MFDAICATEEKPRFLHHCLNDVFLGRDGRYDYWMGCGAVLHIRSEDDLILMPVEEAIIARTAVGVRLLSAWCQWASKEANRLPGSN